MNLRVIKTEKTSGRTAAPALELAPLTENAPSMPAPRDRSSAGPADPVYGAADTLRGAVARQSPVVPGPATTSGLRLPELVDDDHRSAAGTDPAVAPRHAERAGGRAGLEVNEPANAPDGKGRSADAAQERQPSDHPDAEAPHDGLEDRDTPSDPGEETGSPEQAIRAEADSLRKKLAAAADSHEAELGRLRAALEAAEEAAAGAVRAYVEKSAAPLADLAIAIADRILDRELAAETHEATAAALYAAIDELSGHGALDVRISVELAESLDSLRAGAPATGTLRWHSDTRLGPGEWTVDSPAARIRRSRALLLERFEQALGARSDTAEDATP